jgi:hypothetical protein
VVPGPRRGLARLAATLAAAALIVLAAYWGVRLSAGHAVIRVGIALLFAGPLALGAFFVAIAWIERGFQGENEAEPPQTRRV